MRNFEGSQLTDQMTHCFVSNILVSFYVAGIRSPRQGPLARRKLRPGYLLLEALAKLRRPAVVLGLGGKLPLLVTQMRADDVDLHKGPEALCLPLQIVGSHHCVMETLEFKEKEGRGRRERAWRCNLLPYLSR